MSDEVICPRARTERCPLHGKQHPDICRHSGFHRRVQGCDSANVPGGCPTRCVYPDIVTVEKEKPLQ